MTLRAYLAALLGISGLLAQTLEVTPKRALMDQPPAIQVSGLQAGEHVAIRAKLIDGADHTWISQAEFVASDGGTVDLSKQAPVSGSYKSVSAAGLIWSMKPEDKEAKAYQAPKQMGPQLIRFEMEAKGGKAAADFEQLGIADGVKRVEIKGALHGVMFEPQTEGPHPGMLVLGGSEGGLPQRPAAWLASHGYAALALAYFRYDDLPPRLEAIPLEYFGQALTWMRKRSEIAPDRIGVMGTSRGGELALQLGAIYPDLKVVVAYVPSNVRNPSCCGGTRVPYAWTISGRPLAFLPIRHAHDIELIRDAAIQVEKAHGPILMISGEDDGVWESTRMANAVMDRLKQTHFAYSYEHLKYPKAGHRAGHQSITPEWHGTIRHPVSGREVNWGGTPEGNAESSTDASPRVLEFLKQNLK